MLGSETAVARQLRDGELRRVVRGVYRRAEFVPDQQDDADRYLTLLRATQLAMDETLVFSHLSAAALWGLPNPYTWADTVHAIHPPESGGRSNAHVRRHCVPLATAPIEREGLWVTDLARTVTDVARTCPPPVAVCMADAALRGDRKADRRSLTRAEAERIVEANAGARGIKRARQVLAFADPGAESPGESISRWAIHVAGLAAPELQREFRDSTGVMRVDFWWPRFNVIGEFDGRRKYRGDAAMSGVEAEDVVIAEKDREDRLRALGPTVVRWDWSTAQAPDALARLLRSRGIR